MTQQRDRWGDGLVQVVKCPKCGETTSVHWRDLIGAVKNDPNPALLSRKPRYEFKGDCPECTHEWTLTITAPAAFWRRVSRIVPVIAE